MRQQGAKELLFFGPSFLGMCKLYPDSKVLGATMGPTWVMSAPDGSHVGPMNLAIRDTFCDGALADS